MRVIGIVGGVASGKSRVAEGFARLGARIIRADEIGHEVLREPDVKRALRDRWGTEVFGSDGEVDRAAVAGRVFGPGQEEERRYLETLTHPRITAAMQAQLDQWRRDGGVPAAILDAAVLLEAGWHRMCDKIVFVEAGREERFKRASRRGWSEAEFASREAAQISLQEKRKLADGVIDNSGSIDHTFAQVRQFWQSLDLFPPD
jgi:dephospho-CoA kinase